MKKVMISQPMAGKTGAEIMEVRNREKRYLQSMGYEVINSYYSDKWKDELIENIKESKNAPLFFLAESLKAMSCCDAVYFCLGWQDARGCRIEHEAAKAYDLEIIYQR